MKNSIKLLAVLMLFAAASAQSGWRDVLFAPKVVYPMLVVPVIASGICGFYKGVTAHVKLEAEYFKICKDIYADLGQIQEKAKDCTLVWRLRDFVAASYLFEAFLNQDFADDGRIERAQKLLKEEISFDQFANGSRTVYARMQKENLTFIPASDEAKTQLQKSLKTAITQSNLTITTLLKTRAPVEKVYFSRMPVLKNTLKWLGLSATVASTLGAYYTHRLLIG